MVNPAKRISMLRGNILFIKYGISKLRASIGCSESLNGSSIEWESEDIVMLVVGEEEEGGDSN